MTLIDKFFFGWFKCGIYFLIWFIQFGNFSFVWKSMMVVSRRSHGFGRHFSVSGGDGPIILPVHNHSRYGTKIRIRTALTSWSTYFTISSRSTICWQRLKLKRKNIVLLPILNNYLLHVGIEFRKIKYVHMLCMNAYFTWKSSGVGANLPPPEFFNAFGICFGVSFVYSDSA